jgi:hypothetical protein
LLDQTRTGVALPICPNNNLDVFLFLRKVQKEDRGSHEGDYEEYKVCFISLPAALALLFLPLNSVFNIYYRLKIHQPFCECLTSSNFKITFFDQWSLGRKLGILLKYITPLRFVDMT